MSDTNQNLTDQILQLLDLSSMDQAEKNLWTIQLPHMTAEEMEKLKAVLEKEIKNMIDIYLKAKNS